MGMFDVVTFEMDVPGFSLRGRRFQTKTLDCCLDRYTVTSAGRLCMTGSDLARSNDGIEAVDIDFHGDLRMIAEGEGDEYMVRFTHGTLEWIRPLAEVPAERIRLAERSRERGG